MIVYSGVLK